MSQIFGVLVEVFFFLISIALGMISADRNPNESKRKEVIMEICPINPGLVPRGDLCPELMMSGGHKDFIMSNSWGGETGILNFLCL